MFGGFGYRRMASLPGTSVADRSAMVNVKSASRRTVRSWGVIRPHLGTALSFYVAAAIGAAVPLLQILVLREFIDSLGRGEQAQLYVVLLGAFCAVFVLGTIARFASATLSASLAYRIISALQRRMFDRLTTMPLTFYTGARPGAVVSRMTNDVNGIEAMYTEVLPAIVSSTVAIAVSLGLIAAVEPRILLLILLVPLALIVVRRAESSINQLINSSFDIVRRIATSTESLVSRDGILLARQNGRVEDERDKFFRLTGNSCDVSRKIARSAAAANASYDLAFGIMTVVTLGVCVWLATQGRLSIGGVVMTALFVQQLQAPVQTLLGTRYPKLRARIAFDRVFEVLDSGVAADRRSLIRNREPLRTTGGDSDVGLVMRGVSFTYPPPSAYSIEGLSQVGEAISIPWLPMTGFTSTGDDAPVGPAREVLSNFDLRIRAGEVKAIVGRSGSGKSTVAMLAAGMLEPTSGTVEVTGNDIAEMGYASLAARVALITQDTFVLHDTIRANLKYVKPDATDEEIIAACAAARLTTFVEGHADGIDAVVGEKGHRLSGGERQRLSIARALLKNPQLVVLDEATAHLDRRTETEVMNEMLSAFDDKAVLVIAHRLETVSQADEIIVLENGVVVQRGRHGDMLRNDGGAYALLSGAAE
jgi:ATP-binding cassette, subfamily B, bacterial